MFRNPNSTEVALWVWNFSVSVSVLSHSGLHHQHRTSPCTVTTLINIRLSALFDVSQPALPFSCLFHFWESFPKDFLEAAGSCQCHHFPIHQRTLSSRSIAQRYIQERETLAWSLQAFAAKAGIRLPLCCLCCCSSHIYFHYWEYGLQTTTANNHKGFQNSENQISINKRQENAL